MPETGSKDQIPALPNEVRRVRFFISGGKDRNNHFFQPLKNGFIQKFFKTG